MTRKCTPAHVRRRRWQCLVLIVGFVSAALLGIAIPELTACGYKPSMPTTWFGAADQDADVQCHWLSTCSPWAYPLPSDIEACKIQVVESVCGTVDASGVLLGRDCARSWCTSVDCQAGSEWSRWMNYVDCLASTADAPCGDYAAIDLLACSQMWN